jgi:hypothetical protein
MTPFRLPTERIEYMSHPRSRLLQTSRAVRRSALLASASLALVGCMIVAGGAQAATLPTISVSVSPTAIAVTGALQSGAVNVASTASSGKEPAVVFVALKPGVSAAEVDTYLDSNKTGKDPNTVSKYGSIVFDAEAGKGMAGEAQTVLAPGQYVAVNPEGEQSSKWPRTNFAVAASPTPAALAAPVATEKTIEFAFKGPSVLHDGELVRFENEGYVVHMDFGLGVKSKKAAEKVVKGLRSGNEKGLEKLASGPPVSFAGPLSTGGAQQEIINAKPGWYVQACFMPTQDGRPHTLLGMERIIKITK